MSYNYYCNDCGCWFPSERRRTNCVRCGSEEIVDTDDDEDEEDEENSSDNGSVNISGRLQASFSGELGA